MAAASLLTIVPVPTTRDLVFGRLDMESASLSTLDKHKCHVPAALAFCFSCCVMTGGVSVVVDGDSVWPFLLGWEKASVLSHRSRRMEGEPQFQVTMNNQKGALHHPFKSNCSKHPSLLSFWKLLTLQLGPLPRGWADRPHQSSDPVRCGWKKAN